MKQIFELLSREEVMEKQRSHADWLREGDLNTAFFQAKSWSVLSAIILPLYCE
jgi:hypothetical protein